MQCAAVSHSSLVTSTRSSPQTKRVASSQNAVPALCPKHCSVIATQSPAFSLSHKVSDSHGVVASHMPSWHTSRDVEAWSGQRNVPSPHGSWPVPPVPPPPDPLVSDPPLPPPPTPVAPPVALVPPTLLVPPTALVQPTLPSSTPGVPAPPPLLVEGAAAHSPASQRCPSTHWSLLLHG